MLSTIFLAISLGSAPTPKVEEPPKPTIYKWPLPAIAPGLIRV